MSSKLWILRPREVLLREDDPWEPWYDKAFGFVVRAPDEESARGIANGEGGDETGPAKCNAYRTGGDPWLDPAFSTCEELTSGGDDCVIIRDFMSA